MAGLIIAVIVMAVVFGWLLFGDKLAPGEPATKLEERTQKIEISLDDLRERGVKVDGPVVWNYMFVHRDYGQLAKFIEFMKSNGYALAEVNEEKDGDAGLVDYEVRFQKSEAHSPESLARKTEEMRGLASRWRIDLFDGWYPEGFSEPDEMSH
jgi:hypothetical protein